MSLLDAIEGTHKKLLHPSGGCHNCPRRRIDYVPPTLEKTQIIAVGEAPGGTEVKEGKGFTGKAGQFLRKVATECHLPPFSVTNVIHCRPPKNVTPSAKEINCCLSAFILDEIRDYPIVVLFGSTVLSAFFPGAKATHFRGNVAYHPDFPEQRFYMMYHPAYIIRPQGAHLEPEFRKHMERLARIAAGEPEPPWHVIHGASRDTFNALDVALSRPLISLDFETTGLAAWEPHQRIRSLSLTADGQNAIFVHEDEPHWITTVEKLRAYLEKPEKMVIGANVGFDLDWAEHEWDFQVKCMGIHCVLVLYYEWKQYKEPSLKELVATELDGYRYLVHDPSKESNLKLLGRYNAEDCIYAYELFYKAMRGMKPKTRDLTTRVLGPVSLPLRQMHSDGFYLRPDYRAAKMREYEEKRKAEVEAWHDLDSSFIPVRHESGNGLHEYLFKIRHLPKLDFTDKGNPVVDKHTIKQWIRNGATYLTHLLNIREIDKIKSTYLVAYDKHVDSRSRVHSSYINTHTDSGRTSSRTPNLQNIPRKKEIRDLFGVPSGMRLLEADLSQIEFRIMVSLAKDETGIDAYVRGEDAHTTTATTMCGGRKPTKEERSRAKPVNFALCYGGSWEQVQRVARDDYDQDWSDTQCQQFTNDFFATYKRLPDFHRDSRQQLINNRGWFESVLGHIFHYKDWDHPDSGQRDHTYRAALNSEAQGPAAQICFDIMVQTRRLLDKYNMSRVRFVNHVHDSVLIQLPNPKQDADVIELMEQATASTYEWIKSWFLVPLIMDYKGGESWGSLEEYHLSR